jgi:hypothetical protein
LLSVSSSTDACGMLLLRPFSSFDFSFSEGEKINHIDKAKRSPKAEKIITFLVVLFV